MYVNTDWDGLKSSIGDVLPNPIRDEVMQVNNVDDLCHIYSEAIENFSILYFDS